MLKKTVATSTKGMVVTFCFTVLLLSTICKVLGTACDIPPVEIGQTTTLTCHYNEDVLKFSHKIIIMHYRSPDDESPETVLFTTMFDGMVEYYTHPDYVLLTKKDVIQVQIPRVTKKHAGRYACLAIQSISFEECSFTPTDSSKLGPNPSRINKTDSNDTIADNTENNVDYKMIAIVTFSLLGLSICIAIGVWFYRKWSNKNKRNVEKEQKNAEKGTGECEESKSLNSEGSDTPLISCREQEYLEKSETCSLSLTSKDSCASADSGISRSR